MNRTLTRILSTVLHPLLVPTYFLLIIYAENINQAQSLTTHYRGFLLAFIAFSTFLLPVLFTLTLMSLKVLKQFTMHQQNDRFLPLAAMAVFYFFSFYLVRRLPVLPAFTLFLKGSTILVLLAMAINYFYKISLHMLAWGGLAGAIAGTTFLSHQPLYFWLFVALFLSGIVGSARIVCKAHASHQVYVGFISGFAVMLTLFLL